MNLCITWNCLNDKTTMGLCDKMLSHYRDSYGRDLGYRDENSRKTVIEYETDTGRTKRIQTSGAWFTYYFLAGTDLKSRLQYGGSGSAYYTYEPNRDLLTQVQNYINGGVISQYDYTNDALGRRTAITRSGSMMTESRTDAYGYNDRNELVSRTKDTAATNLTEYAYQYDDIGNRIISLDLGTNRTYTANALNQYTSISNSALSATLGTRSARLGRYPMGRDHPQGADIREIFTPTFDLDMRPRQRRRVARRSEATEPRSGRKRPRNQTLVRTATGDWTVAYNAENRPVSWTCGATNIVMLFDRMGRRVEYVETVTDGSGESTVTTTNRHHRFVYEITAAQAGRAHWALQAERTERSDEVPREPRYLCVQRLNARSGNAIELSFAWDPTEPVATRPLVLQRQGGWNFFYTHDMRPRRRRRVARRSVATEPRSGRKRPRNKNVSDVVSFQQARGVPAHYEYAPFGAVTAATTNTAFTAFNVAEANPFRFSSEYADDTLGLVYYNYRHYNPCVGRWLNRDPIEEEGGENLYTFCGNNPVLYVDVNGEFFLVDTLVMGALGGVIGGVSAALTGGDIGAGIAGGFISGACISICPAAAAECGAAGGAVAGFISGVRGANKAKLCGAKWHLHVAGSVVIGTVLGKYSGKLSSRLSDGLSQAAGGILTSTTTRTSSFSVSLSVVGPDIATSISCGVTSTAVEMVFLTTPEAAKKAIDEIGNGYNKTIERIDMEFEASGQFK